MGKRAEKVVRNLVRMFVREARTSWEPSPISPGRMDFLVTVPGAGTFYAGSYGPSAGSGYTAEAVMPDFGRYLFSQTSEKAAREFVEREWKKWTERDYEIDLALLKKQAADWKRWTKYVSFIMPNEKRFAALPHPFSWQEARGLTMMDYLRYLLTSEARAQWKRAHDTARSVVG